MKNILPPRWASKLLEWYCKPSLYEDLQGDLFEYFERNLHKRGTGYAKLIYIIDVLKFFRLYTVRRRQLFGTSNQLIMIRSYLKIALRSMSRSKSYTAINIAGLTLGLTCALFIAFYVAHEISYDRFHADNDRILRISSESVSEAGISTLEATTPPGLALLLKDNLPEIQQMVRLMPSTGGRNLVQVDGKSFYELGMCRADSSLFDVLSFNFIHGSAATALHDPHSAVLTESSANRYFGTTDCMGKTLQLEDNWMMGIKTLTVSAVVEDLPSNSHLQFTMFRPIRGTMWSDFANDEVNNWRNRSFYTYVKLHKEVSAEAFEAKIESVVKSHRKELKGHFFTQSISDIHLYSSLQSEMAGNSSYRVIYLLGTIALIIMVVACINYVNMATARALGRAKEVGIRKVNGASKSELVYQFIFESVLLACISFALAIVFVWLLMPSFNTLADKNFEMASVTTINGWLFIFAGVILIGVLAGMYPAFYLSRFKPVSALKGAVVSGSKSSVSLRQALVAIQFVVSIGLVIATAVIHTQITYIRNKDLGISKSQVIVLPECNDEARRKNLKHLLLQHPFVEEAGSSSGRLAGNFWSGRTTSASTGQEIGHKLAYIDDSYFKAAGIEVVERWEHPSLPDSVSPVIINETAARLLGLQQPIGETLILPGSHTLDRIVGVVKDFHFSSLHEAIEPIIFMEKEEFLRNTYVRIAPGSQPEEAVAGVRAAWEEAFPGRLFEYYFLDQQYDQLYKADEKFGKMVSLMTSIAIFIALLGLLGLTSYAVRRRTREIGIRKVLGASPVSILALIARSILMIVALSEIVALPLSAVFMSKWLDSFAYRIALLSNLWIFIAAGAGVLCLAMLAVMIQTLTAALKNPVESLRTE
ncbi:FtsX-like permease family protein [Imperialibacter roseus]|uniref:FtsX-like permease family protein n=1 Tax=Imperialibacter roseus TaxID=1324217 RepID=A0ABZ0ISJ0_9BACT|nr:ABC transporter permease [Imperialibacter roseus]WOK07556.1 FtsX-like permease family protein [Imperialibacter roseus]